MAGDPQMFDVKMFLNISAWTVIKKSLHYLTTLTKKINKKKPMGIIRLSIVFAESFKHLRVNFMKLTRRLPEEKNIIRKSYLENDQQEHKEQK